MLAINWREILTGRGTALYQPFKRGDNLQQVIIGIGWGGVWNGSDYRYEVGKEYSLQPAGNRRAIWWRNLGEIQTTADYRCPESVKLATEQYLRWDGWQPLRVRVVAIGRIADVRQANLTDTGMEDGFLAEWVERYDKGFKHIFAYANDTGWLKEYGFYERPDRYYAAWRLEIKLLDERKKDV